MADDVADEHATERCSEPGRKIAHLIGMREKHVRGTMQFDQWRKRGDVAVRRVFGEEFVLDRMNFGDL